MQVDRAKLTPNTRVALDVTTLTIMRVLPREVDPMVFNMTQVRVCVGGWGVRVGGWAPGRARVAPLWAPLTPTLDDHTPLAPAGGPRQGGLLIHRGAVRADQVRVRMFSTVCACVWAVGAWVGAAVQSC